VHPIDESVHAVMNVSLRPAIKKFLCGPGAAMHARVILFLQMHGGVAEPKEHVHKCDQGHG
jgi:hypothetical protein